MKRSRRAVALLSLIALPALATAAPADSPSQVEQEAALRQMLDEAIKAMFLAGDPEPNWSNGGVDLEKLVKAMPDHVLLEIDSEGERSISLYSERHIAEFIPADWELVAEIGQEDSKPSGGQPIEIGQLDDGYFVASRGASEQVGSAYCSNLPTVTRLYKVKGTNSQLSPELAAFIFREMFRRAKSYTVCSRTDIAGEGYRNRYFLKDGRSLPFFDDRSGKVTIVPRRPITDLMKGK